MMNGAKTKLILEEMIRTAKDQRLGLKVMFLQDKPKLKARVTSEWLDQMILQV